MAPISGRPLVERLARLHRLYAWSLLAMLLSGLVLYLPGLRGPLAAIRAPLRQAHIAAGVAQIVLIAAYLRLLLPHWRSLGPWLGKRINLVISLLLAAGWSLSGAILWWDRAFLPYTQAALFWHDLLTWVGGLYLAGHAVVRYFKIELALPWARVGPRRARPLANPIAAYRLAKAIERRRFLTRVLKQGGMLLGGSWLVGWWLKQRREVELPALAQVQPAARAPAYPVPQPDPRSSPPVGGGAKGHFRIYNVARSMPHFDPYTWRLEVNGLVRRELSLTWEQVIELPRDVWVRDFHCVSGWSVRNVTWEGIPLSALLDLAGVLPQATHVKFYSYDGVYTDALTLEQARLDDTFLAMLKDGKLLTDPEGAPLRLIMPRMFAYKSVKWVTRIELIDQPHMGFWERLGYAEDAWIPGVDRSGPSPRA